MKSAQIVQVAVPLPLKDSYSYLAQEGAKPGDYVKIPFGTKTMQGVVWSKDAEEEPRKLKEISEVLEFPLMPFNLRKFIDWVADYTLFPRGAVLKMALPIPEALNPPQKPMEAPSYHFRAIALSPSQHQAVERLKKKKGAFSVTLLDGVTGSGKTEVYFEMIAETLKAGGQSLILLPEIALSPQWRKRFEARFGAPALVWHSDIAKGRKKHIWRQVATGESKVVVGARSALFLPFKELKLIVVDEEHEASYKQEDGVIYHARDMAVVRASIERIPILLASATPSLETVVNVQDGKYDTIVLAERHGTAAFPELSLIDMRENPPEKDRWLSPALKQAMVETLGQGRQVLLYLNRRGYAPLTLCRACGYRYECPHCSAWLVFHQSRRSLECHHCGYHMRQPHQCQSCSTEESLALCGPGVERVTEEVEALFPHARIQQMTSDHLGGSKTAKAVEDILKGEADIIIGTQMVAKGHHFPKLSLVGVVDADLGLAGGDLRATERSWQLLHQVAGRAGREEEQGRAMLQTYLPEHPIMQALRAGDREAFLREEEKARKFYKLPPFGRLAAVILEGTKEEAVARLARELARKAPQGKGFSVLGPAPAPLARLKGKYRYRLLLKAEKQISVQKILKAWLEGVKIPSTIRLKVDVDPYHFI